MNRDNRAYGHHRRWLYETYDGKCWMCGHVADQIDHIVPISRGGSDDRQNLRLACQPCNLKRNLRDSRFNYSHIPAVWELVPGELVYGRITLHWSMYTATSGFVDDSALQDVHSKLTRTDPPAAARMMQRIERGEARQRASSQRQERTANVLWAAWERGSQPFTALPVYPHFAPITEWNPYIRSAMSYIGIPPTAIEVEERLRTGAESHLAKDEPWSSFPTEAHYLRTAETFWNLPPLRIDRLSYPVGGATKNLRHHTILMARDYLRMSDADILSRGIAVATKVEAARTLNANKSTRKGLGRLSRWL